MYILSSLVGLKDGNGDGQFDLLSLILVENN